MKKEINFKLTIKKKRKECITVYLITYSRSSPKLEKENLKRSDVSSDSIVINIIITLQQRSAIWIKASEP